MMRRNQLRNRMMRGVMIFLSQRAQGTTTSLGPDLSIMMQPRWPPVRPIREVPIPVVGLPNHLVGYRSLLRPYSQC